MSDDPHKNDEANDFHKEDLPEGVTLREHVVDGIYEYDQRLPKWWLIILFSVIFFSGIYWVALDQREYQGAEDKIVDAKMAAINAKRLASSIDVTNNDLFWEMSSNPDFLAAGQATYEANCVACHGQNLEGGIGFNLVDGEWVHGAAPSSIYVTIDKGIPEKGMQAWGSVLGQKRIAEVVAYVLSKNDRATMEAAPQSKAGSAPGASSDSSTAEVLDDEDPTLAHGKQIYDVNCAVCHNHNLKGKENLGSDLTDDVWTEGGSRDALIATVTNGIPAKAMVPWKNMLSEEDIAAVVDFILSKAE